MNKIDQISDAEGKLASSLDELASFQSSLTENIPGCRTSLCRKALGLDVLRERIVECLDDAALAVRAK